MAHGVICKWDVQVIIKSNKINYLDKYICSKEIDFHIIQLK